MTKALTGGVRTTERHRVELHDLDLRPTAELVRLINDEDRRSASRVPGISDLPVVGRLFSNNDDTVNKTEAVWLNTMKDAGASIDIEGYALSSDAVATLIANLQKTGYFKNVEIKETSQDASIKEMQAFLFTLTCEKGGNGNASSSASDKSGAKLKSL